MPVTLSVALAAATVAAWGRTPHAAYAVGVALLVLLMVAIPQHLGLGHLAGAAPPQPLSVALQSPRRPPLRLRGSESFGLSESWCYSYVYH